MTDTPPPPKPETTEALLSSDELAHRPTPRLVSKWNIWNGTWGHWALAESLDSEDEATALLPVVRKDRTDKYSVQPKEEWDR